VVQFGDASGCAVLVENKVTAPLSLNQAEDYRKRGQAWVAEKRSAAYRTCIIAPATWLGVHSQHGFDVAVSYEEIADKIAENEDPRSLWRADVFRQGGRRAQKKLTFSNDQVAEFLRTYYAVARERCPELGTASSTGSKSLIVVYPLSLGRKLELGRWVDVQHNIPDQRMKLTIGSCTKADAEAALSSIASENGWLIVQNGQRVDVTAEVPNLDLDKPVAEQRAELDEAFSVARQMVEVAHAQADLIRALPLSPSLSSGGGGRS
jgi:hypothetical protein